MQDHSELIARARTWLAEDPDPETREELAKLIDAEDTEELTARFTGTLQFGTAGLRGELGAGPMRMNRSVVIRAAAGLAAYLKAKGSRDGLVVIGYDARHKSADFARDTAAVMTGAGLRAAVLPRPLPTPVLAFAIRHLGAVAGVEVTASHNPPRDNGYKVYLGDGSQIVPPADAEIAAEIDAVDGLDDVPRPETGWEILGDEVLDAYLARTDAVLAPESPAPPAPSTRRCTASARRPCSRRSTAPASPPRSSWPSRPSRTRTSRRSRSRTRRSRARWTWPSRRRPVPPPPPT
ncbi:Phosphoglucosamine mutase [Streptomyces alboniger]